MTAAAKTAAPIRTRGEFKPTLVHAYRREPYKDMEGKEKPVEVVAQGEKVAFASNSKGHIVGLVTTKALYDHLIKNIPEGYIPYMDGENIPERGTFDEPAKTTGKYVLTNGKKQLILDDMSEDDLKEFAEANELNIHASVAGDDLRQAIVNHFKTD